MKGNIKKVMTAIAATAMCAVTMTSTLTANADDIERTALSKTNVFTEVQKKTPVVTTVVNNQAQKKTTTTTVLRTGDRPIQTEVVTKLTPSPIVTRTIVTVSVPIRTKLLLTATRPITYINPVTDPIGPRIDLKDQCYAVDPKIKTTTVRTCLY